MVRTDFHDMNLFFCFKLLFYIWDITHKEPTDEIQKKPIKSHPISIFILHQFPFFFLFIFFLKILLVSY